MKLQKTDWSKERISDMMKDAERFQQYFEEADPIIELTTNLITEQARLVMAKELVTKMLEIKKDFVDHVHKINDNLEGVRKELKAEYDQRLEIQEELNRSRLRTLALSEQTYKITDMFKALNFNEKLIKNVVEQSKIYIARCVKCKKETRGTLDEIALINKCESCKSEIELMVGHIPA